jgi:hypothetical protein
MWNFYLIPSANIYTFIIKTVALEHFQYLKHWNWCKRTSQKNHRQAIPKKVHMFTINGTKIDWKWMHEWNLSEMSILVLLVLELSYCLFKELENVLNLRFLYQWLKSTIFWDVMPYGLVSSQTFRGMYYLHLQGQKISQTSIQCLLLASYLLFARFSICTWRWKECIPPEL